MRKPVSTLFIISIQMILISCATVKFDVDHPPVVDLRGVNSITVIPFEWSGAGEYAHIASRVTSALLSGLERGRITVVDPYSLENVYPQNYGRHVDAYITGRIINIGSYDYVESREEAGSRGQMETISIVTRTVTVDIEYSYIRSVNREVLGYFRKSATSSDYFTRLRNWNDTRTQYGQQRQRMRRTQRASRGYRQRDDWTDSIALSAIARFPDTMSHELGPWTTTEKRSIRGHTGSEPGLAEARKLVRLGQYGRALDLYSEVYGQTGNVLAGYNMALLLEANEQFAEALALLERLDKTAAESGKKSPAFIRKEIVKMAKFISEYKVLESIRAEDARGTGPVEGSASVGGAFAESPPAGDYRTVIVTDEAGRILRQTITEGSNVKITEYEYNGAGDRIAQRDFNNGILERQVLINGNTEIEELFMNGVLVLRAHWENGRKISEERIRQR